jgi:hypothetical protein
MTKALLLVVVLLPASAAAQGLGDAAAREQKKREETKAPVPARVFTNQDLPKPGEASEPAAGDPAESGAAGSAVPAEPASPDSSGAPPAPADALEKERQERKLLEAEWRVRFANAREQIAVAEAACWQEVVRTQFYNGIPVQMKIKEFVESEELRRSKAALADLEEEFRRTGLPPGWARED